MRVLFQLFVYTCLKILKRLAGIGFEEFTEMRRIIESQIKADLLATLPGENNHPFGFEY